MYLLIAIGVAGILFQKKLLRRSFKWMGVDGVFISMTLIAIGMGVTSLQMQPLLVDAMPSTQEVKAMDVQLVNDPVLKERSVKLFVQVRFKKDSSKWNSVNEKMLVYLQRSPNSEKLKYGDEVLLNASPEPIAGPKNPEEFDYKSWLERQGVQNQAYAKSGEWKWVSGGNGNWFKSLALDLRRFYLGKLQEYGLSGSSFGVAAALLLGASDHLDPGTIQAYSASGTLHVLSVSGMHVALVYVVLLKLLLPFEKRKGGKWLSIVIQLVFIWFYATLTGLCPSVLRSVTMLSVVIAGRAFSRNAHILNSLAASALILLVMDPMLLFDIGFQLSYLAVGGIVLLQPKLEALWEPNENTFLGKLLKPCWTLISVTLVAQVFTFPMGLYYFQQFPTYFLLSNLIIIPLSTIVMYAGLFFLIISPIKMIAKPIATLFAFLVHLLNASVTQIEHLPHAVFHTAKWEQAELLLLYLFIIFLLLFLNQYRARNLQLGMISFLLLMGLSGCHRWKQLNSSEIVLFDVKRSTAIGVLNGKDFVLFADSSLMKNNGDMDFHIEPYLKSKGIENEKIILLNESNIFQSDFVHGGKNFIFSMNKKVTVVDRDFELNSNLKLDVVLLKNNTRINLEDLVLICHPILLVADESNSKRQIEKWRGICATLQLPFYDMKTKGALILPLGNPIP